MYTRRDPVLTENALKVLERAYLRGETPAEMFDRVAKAVATAENTLLNEKEENLTIKEIEDMFYEVMAELYFLPNSPTLMNAGRPLAQLAACFVLPIEDNMEGIFDAIKYMAIVQKSGGGTGFNFSRLRPAGELVSSTIGEASGPISFMRVFNSATEEVKQGGARRGANMGILRVDHPDILAFIDAKSDTTKLTNFNMSVALTDVFMTALAADSVYELVFEGKSYGRLKARDVMNKIVDRAWTTGEPGVIFIDEINRFNPTPHQGELETTNPCGEQPLLPFEACNLGSINLSNMVVSGMVDFARLWRVVNIAVRFLDNVIEINHYPLPQIEDMAKGNRKIGLGVMGWADMLFKLNIPYDSQEAVDLAGVIMKFIDAQALAESMRLGKIRGAYPNYKISILMSPCRNATRTTIAPTGTLSLVAAVSSGIEPLFALAYNKELTAGGTCKMLNPVFLQTLHEFGYSEDTIASILEHVKTYGTIRNCQDIDVGIARVFKTASEIAPEWHVKMQAAFQAYTDNAVSKTINFNNDVKREDIYNAILLAYKLKCKGLTVYRDGSRDSQPLVIGDAKAIAAEQNFFEATLEQQVFERPEVMPGFTVKARTGCGNMFVTVNHLDDEVKEVFLKTGNSGGCTAFTEALGRVISVGLKYGTPLDQLIDQVTSVRCDNFRHQVGRDNTLKGKSCPDVVGSILRNFSSGMLVDNDAHWVQKKFVADQSNQLYKTHMLGQWGQADNAMFSAEELLKAGKCPECQEKLQRVEGCIKCDCGFSKC